MQTGRKCAGEQLVSEPAHLRWRKSVFASFVVPCLSTVRFNMDELDGSQVWFPWQESTGAELQKLMRGVLLLL